MRVKSYISPERLRIIGDRIRASRNALSLSQEEFAERLDVTRETVGQWERGNTPPSFDAVTRICDLCHCDADYIMGRLDCQTHDLQYVHDLTGLSENAIKKVITISDTNRAHGMTDTLSRLIEHPNFLYLLSLLPISAPGNLDAFTIGNAHISGIERQAAIRSEIKSTIDKISDDIRDQTPTDPATVNARIMFKFLYGLRDAGSLTDDQFKQTLAAYDKGDYD